MEIPEKLIHAYRNTKYLVPSFGISICIGTYTPDLDLLLEKYELWQWAFITAWNPYSVQLSEVDNALRHQSLVRLTESYLVYEGLGMGVDSEWQPEQSLLILGIEKGEAIKLGKLFHQYAIVTAVKG